MSPSVAMSMEDFQRELRTAYRQQLLSHDQVTREFFNKIAQLCEQVPDSGPAIATILQDMGPPSIPVSGVEADSGQRDKLSDTQISQAVPMQFVDAAPPKAELLGGRCDEIEDLPVGAVLSGDAEDDATKETHPMLHHQKTHGSHGDTADNFETENSIGRLAFIDENGELLRPPSTLEHVLGPRLNVVKSRLKEKLCCCEASEGMLSFLVESGGFKLLSALVIVTNYIFIMMQCDYRMANLNTDEPAEMQAVGFFFTAYYTAELCLLLMVRRREFFLGPEKAWNLFDGAIVFVALVELGFKFAGGPTINSSFLRILRFFKISRVLRMFSAIRMFKEIRIMVDALAGCFVIFIFCVLMLTIFISIFSIFFVQGAAGYLESRDNVHPDDVQLIRLYYGTVYDCMVVLFSSCTGGDDWRMYHEVIKQVGWVYDALFLIFIVAYYIAFFNVVTSVFCEKAISLATPTTGELVVRRLEKEHRDARELMSLLQRALCDDDGDNKISHDNFDQFIKDPEVELYFQVRGCNAQSAHKFFNMLCDIHETNDVDFATFISALVKLDGVASSIDAHVLSVRQMHELDKLKALGHSQHQEFAWLRQEIQKLSGTSLTSKALPMEGCSQQKVLMTPERTSGSLGSAREASGPPPSTFDDMGNLTGRSLVSATSSGRLMREWV